MGKVGTGEEGINYSSTVSCTRVCWLYKHKSRPASINLVQKSHHEERELLSSYSIGTTSDHWGVGFADAIIESLNKDSEEGEGQRLMEVLVTF